MTNTTTTTDPALILAGIIRQVWSKHELGADALAQAILAHPGSRWGPTATAATPEFSAPAALPEISDSLMRSLICDILYMLTKATDKALGGGYFSPVPQIRARLMEILQLAAQDEAELNHD